MSKPQEARAMCNSLCGEGRAAEVEKALKRDKAAHNGPGTVLGSTPCLTVSVSQSHQGLSQSYFAGYEP